MSGYIGTQPVPQATQTRDAFTATSNQTSFATSGYTPNFLDVFLNGVKLSAADYTASNGSDVVLATGAATGDILEVVAYTTFDTANVTGAADFTVTGSFTSQGIDDNANATAITIDSSENVLVGKTSNSFGTTGVALNPDGSNNMTRSGDPALALNRLSSDGAILGLYKDGATVGSIGSESGNIFFEGGTNKTGIRVSGSGILPRDNGVDADDAVSLGQSALRFKNLYLSGGVYLGGTGAGNKLEDVEVGNFTPFLDNATGGNTASYSSQSGHYVKVGDLIYCQFRIHITAKGSGSGNIRVGGLPFSTATDFDFAGANCDLFYANAATSWVNLKAGARSGNTQLYVYGQTAATTNTIREGNFTSSNINSNFTLRGSITYRGS